MYESISAPSSVLRSHNGWDVELVWNLVPEAATWRLRNGDAVRYLKVAKQGWEPSLGEERERMKWAAARLPVPRVLDYDVHEGIEWLLTDALPGANATDPELLVRPADLVPVLARGLRAFHDVPAHGCPFRFELDHALREARRRADEDLIDPGRHFHPEHGHLSVAAALAQLETTRPVSEDLVLCHGDYCLPNVLIESGWVTGYVDLGELGVADRWWDLATATWSVTWNLGPGWEDVFLSAYRVEADPDRTRYYRLLYDLVS